MPNEKQFIALIKQNEGILHKISNLYADNTVDREDLRQEMIYQLWRSFDSFKGKSQIHTWIYRVAFNTAMVFLNKKKRKIKVVEMNEKMLQKADENDFTKEERLAQLYEVIKKLNKIDRVLIMLHLEGKNYKEISEVTGHTETNVGTRLNRIRVKLKEFVNTK